jgi:hypothetical protein
MGSERVAYSRGEKTPPDLNANFTIGRVEIDEHDPYYTSQAGKQIFTPSCSARANISSTRFANCSVAR